MLHAFFGRGAGGPIKADWAWVGLGCVSVVLVNTPSRFIHMRHCIAPSNINTRPRAILFPWAGIFLDTTACGFTSLYEASLLVPIYVFYDAP